MSGILAPLVRFRRAAPPDRSWPVAVTWLLGLGLGGLLGWAALLLPGAGAAALWGLALLGAGLLARYAEPVVVEPPAPAAPAPEPPRRSLIEAVAIPAGRFLMGSEPADDATVEGYARDWAAIVGSGVDEVIEEVRGWLADEQPPHPVQVSALQTARTALTRGQWRRLMPEAPADWATDARDAELPATQIDWAQALACCNALSDHDGLTRCYVQDADGWRLPTEAEWEYACRAGTETRWFWGDDPKPADRYAWYRGNAGRRWPPRWLSRRRFLRYSRLQSRFLQRVGRRRPNPWGLHDMAGLVFEWCWDGYGAYPSDGLLLEDPSGPLDGDRRVVRGGSFGFPPVDLRSADRVVVEPEGRGGNLGLRCVRSGARQH